MRMLELTVRLLTGTRYTDTSSGFRAFDREVLEFFARTYPSEYMESVEALVQASYEGFRIVEIPIGMNARAGGDPSTMHAKLAYHYFRVIVTLLVRSRRRPPRAAPDASGARSGVVLEPASAEPTRHEAVRTSDAERRRLAGRSDQPAGTAMTPSLLAALLAGEADGLDQIGEMSPRTHAAVFVATVICVGFILRLVRRHGLRSKYTLLWLSLAVVLAALGVFPGLLVAASRVLGINYPPAAFLTLATGFLFLIVIQFSWELSRIEERTRMLAGACGPARRRGRSPAQRPRRGRYPCPTRPGPNANTARPTAPPRVTPRPGTPRSRTRPDPGLRLRRHSVPVTTVSDRPTTSPPARLAYEPSLDGLRGLALMAIIVYHSGLDWAPGAFLSVSTFFTLSGFLITALLLAEHQRDGGISLRQFWSRRLRRLLPASVAVIAAITAAAIWFADSTQLARLRGDALASLAYVANWRFIATGDSYAAGFESPSPFTHFWTLAIEEQFYVALPLLVVLVLAVARGSRRMLSVVFIALTVASLLWSMHLESSGATTDRLYFGTDVRCAELFAGALLAVWWMRRDDPLGRPWTAVGAGVGAARAGDHAPVVDGGGSHRARLLPRRPARVCGADPAGHPRMPRWRRAGLAGDPLATRWCGSARSPTAPICCTTRCCCGSASSRRCRRWYGC